MGIACGAAVRYSIGGPRGQHDAQVAAPAREPAASTSTSVVAGRGQFPVQIHVRELAVAPLQPVGQFRQGPPICPAGRIKKAVRLL
jgi:hypothetical protein